MISHEAVEATQQIAVEISKLLTRFGLIPRGGFPGTLQEVERIVQNAIDGAVRRRGVEAGEMS